MLHKKEKIEPVKLERVSGLQSEKDMQEALDVIVSSFPKEPRMRQHMEMALWKGPVFKPEHTRIAVVDGHVVSVIVMAPRTVWVDSVKVPAMTVGPVATLESYRKQGYCRTVMEDVHRYMEQNGILLAYLQGGIRIYGRFGYFRYLHGGCGEGTSEIKTEDAEIWALRGRLRRMRYSDISYLARLYERVNAGRTMAAIRNRNIWEWMIKYAVNTWLFSEPHVILDEKGRLCGYLTFVSKDSMGIREFVVDDDEVAWRATLGALSRRARKLGSETITLPLPWEASMTLFLRQMVGVKFSTTIRRGGGALMKIVNFPKLMRNLQPLFNERWKKRTLRCEKIRFTLASEIGDVGITLSNNTITICQPDSSRRAWIPLRWLPGLISGIYSVYDIAIQKESKIPDTILPILDILFPAGWPVTYRADMY